MLVCSECRCEIGLDGKARGPEIRDGTAERGICSGCAAALVGPKICMLCHRGIDDSGMPTGPARESTNHGLCLECKPRYLKEYNLPSCEECGKAPASVEGFGKKVCPACYKTMADGYEEWLKKGE